MTHRYLLLLLAALLAVPATAQTLDASPSRWVPSTGGSNDIIWMGDTARTLGGLSMSQSTSDVVEGGFACRQNETFIIRETRMFRAFRLSDFGLTSGFQMTGFLMGLNESFAADGSESQLLTMRLHILDDPGLPVTLGNLITLNEINLGVPDVAPPGGLVGIAGLDGLAPIGPDDVLVIEFAVPTSNNKFFFGVNDDGESAPTYWAAPPCGVTEIESVQDGVGPGFNWVVSLQGVVPSPPANDNLGNAFVLTDNGRYTGNNVAATLQSGEPVPACASAFGASVWWTFSPFTTGVVTIDATASSFDTVMQIIDTSSGQSIACNDDPLGTPASGSLLTEVPVVGGRTYAVQIGGWQARQGSVAFDYTLGPPPGQGLTCYASDASASVYQGAWAHGSNDSDRFGPWSLDGFGISPNVFGYFSGTSTANADGDSNGDGDIDTGGRAWGLYGSNGQPAVASRVLSHPVRSGESFSFRFDNGLAESGSRPGVDLVDGTSRVVVGIAYDPLVSAQFYSLFYLDGGSRATRMPVTDEGVEATVRMTSATEFAIKLVDISTGFSVLETGRVNPQATGEIVGFLAYNANAESGPPRDFFVNSLEACYTDTGGVSSEDAVDARLALALAGPNPAASGTALAVTLAEPGAARLSVVDLLGREVALVADRSLAAGTTLLDLDTSSLPAGVYLARLVSAGQTRTLPFSVVR